MVAGARTIPAAEDRLDRWERLEAEKRRKRAELAARVEAELPLSRPEGLYQFAPGSWSKVDPASMAENLKAMAEYIRARDAQRPWRITAPSGRSVVAWQTDVTLPGSVWAMQSIRFDGLRLRRSPWWARAIAWGIAVYYAVRG